MVRFIITRVLLFSCLLFAISCNKEEGVPCTQEKQITIFFDPNGLGDRAMNDKIYKGFCTCQQTKDAYYSTVIPNDWEDAEELVKQWIADSSDTDRLLILANETYESIVRNLNIQNTKHSQILLFGSFATDLNVYTRAISQYGASYWAGTRVPSLFEEDSSGNPQVHIFAANPIDANVTIARQGFLDGLASKTDTTNYVTTHYMSNTVNCGYTDYDEACSVLSQFQSNFFFVFPILNGCNEILRYYMEKRPFGQTITENKGLYFMSTNDSLTLYLKEGIQMFSLDYDYESVMNNFITQWYDNQIDTKSCIYGINSTFVRIFVVPIVQFIVPTITDEEINNISEIENKYLMYNLNKTK